MTQKDNRFGESDTAVGLQPSNSPVWYDMKHTNSVTSSDKISHAKRQFCQHTRITDGEPEHSAS